MTYFTDTESLESLPFEDRLFLEALNDFHIEGDKVFKLAPDANPPENENNIIKFPAQTQNVHGSSFYRRLHRRLFISLS